MQNISEIFEDKSAANHLIFRIKAESKKNNKDRKRNEGELKLVSGSVPHVSGNHTSAT